MAREKKKDEGRYEYQLLICGEDGEEILLQCCEDLDEQNLQNLVVDLRSQTCVSLVQLQKRKVEVRWVDVPCIRRDLKPRRATRRKLPR